MESLSIDERIRIATDRAWSARDALMFGRTPERMRAHRDAVAEVERLTSEAAHRVMARVSHPTDANGSPVE